jgi:hypothetical protein
MLTNIIIIIIHAGIFIYSFFKIRAQKRLLIRELSKTRIELTQEKGANKYWVNEYEKKSNSSDNLRRRNLKLEKQVENLRAENLNLVRKPIIYHSPKMESIDSVKVTVVKPPNPNFLQSHKKRYGK